MKKQLYFVCPTDNLESVINSAVAQRNHYYTSLGNSASFNGETVYHVARLILKHSISEITFVLSSQNQMVLDALEGRNFPRIRGMDSFYHEILELKKQAALLAPDADGPHLVLSYYLNRKIKELQFGLAGLKMDQLNINGWIYDPVAGLFSAIYSNLICSEYISLN